MGYDIVVFFFIVYFDFDLIDVVFIIGLKYNLFDNDDWILFLVEFICKVFIYFCVKVIGVCFGY